MTVRNMNWEKKNGNACKDARYLLSRVLLKCQNTAIRKSKKSNTYESIFPIY